MDWKMIIRNFRHKKLQTILIFLIILLCSMLLTSSVSILISLDKPFEDLAEECESPQAVLYPYFLEEEGVSSLGKEFEKLEEIQRVEYIRYHKLTEEVTFNEEKLDNFFYLSEFNSKLNSKDRYLEGNPNIIDTLKANECILPACISNEYDIHTGDIIRIKLSNKTLEYTVRAVYTNPYNFSTAFDSSILVKKLPQSISQQLLIFLYTKEGVKGSDIEEAFRLKNDGQMNGSIYTLEQRIDTGLIVGNIIGGAFLSIGIIMLLVSCLIISFMIRNAIITDAKTIALYKTIGYTSGDILKIYLTFYFGVTTIASIFGIGSSVFISDKILSSVYKNIGELSSNSSFIPGILCYLVIVSIVIGLIYLIMRKTKKLKPVYALNGMTEANTKKKHKYKGDSKLQFSPFGITMRNISRNKEGTVGTILTAVLTIFSVNFAIISLDLADSMKENNDFWMGVDKCDVMIEVSDNTQYAKVVNTIKEDYRVSKFLENRIGQNVSMRWKKGIKTTALSAFVFDDFNVAKLPIVKGRNPNNRTEIAITGKIAGELNKDIGDYLEIYLDNSTRVDLLITGIFQTYWELGDCCRLTTDTFRDNKINLDYSNISVYLKDKEDITAFIKEMTEKLAGSGNVTARTEAFSNIMNMIVNPQKGAIPPVTGLVLIIGAINIFCIVMLKNATNQKTNGIYKCIGYTTGHLLLSNIYYVGIIAVASMAVAIPMVIQTFPLIFKTSLSMFGFLEYPVVYNMWHIVIANIGIAVIFILSTIISSRSLKNVNVRDLVQE